MEKIRINNDIDIVVELKNEAGEVMQPQSLRNIAVVLSTGLKKHKVEDFTLLSNGVGFRFRASEQARTGVYDISVTAETADGRAFATDVCKAFELFAAGGTMTGTLDLLAQSVLHAGGASVACLPMAGVTNKVVLERSIITYYGSGLTARRECAIVTFNDGMLTTSEVRTNNYDLP